MVLGLAIQQDLARNLHESSHRLPGVGVRVWRMEFGVEGSGLGCTHQDSGDKVYRGTSLIRNRAPPGPYSRPMPRVLGGS